MLFRSSIPQDSELADELVAIRYRHTPDGKIQIEDKERIKMKLGRSPDAADMLSLLWERGTDFGLIQAQPTTTRPEPEQW